MKNEQHFNYRMDFLLTFLNIEDIIRDNVDTYEVMNRYDRGDVVQLQDFIGKYLKNKYTWMTSIGLIDAMDCVFKDAISNGNI